VYVFATGFLVGAAVGLRVGDGEGVGDGDGMAGSSDVAAGKASLESVGFAEVRSATNASDGLTEGLADGGSVQPPGRLAETATAATSKASTAVSSLRRWVLGANRRKNRVAAPPVPGSARPADRAAKAPPNDRSGSCRTGWAMRRLV
jgi:hypothetical protein